MPRNYTMLCKIFLVFFKLQDIKSIIYKKQRGLQFPFLILDEIIKKTYSTYHFSFKYIVYYESTSTRVVRPYRDFTLGFYKKIKI